MVENMQKNKDELMEDKEEVIENDDERSLGIVFVLFLVTFVLSILLF
jgi:hypothetical protein